MEKSLTATVIYIGFQSQALKYRCNHWWFRWKEKDKIWGSFPSIYAAGHCELSTRGERSWIDLLFKERRETRDLF